MDRCCANCKHWRKDTDESNWIQGTNEEYHTCNLTVATWTHDRKTSEPPLIPKHKSRAYTVGAGAGSKRVMTTKDYYCNLYEGT